MKDWKYEKKMMDPQFTELLRSFQLTYSYEAGMISYGGFKELTLFRDIWKGSEQKKIKNLFPQVLMLSVQVMYMTKRDQYD